MSHRKVTTTRQETNLEYTCDRCGRRAYPGRHECCMCGRDLCDQCYCYTATDNTQYCRPCWDRGAMYRAEIDRLRLDWMQACIDVRKVEEARGCPKCGSENCKRFVESDAPPDGANMICKECGELFKVEE